MTSSATILTNEPRSYVEHKIDGIVTPAIVGKGVNFDQSVDRFRSSDEPQDLVIYKNAEEEREQLLKAMDDFKAHLKVNKQQSIIKDDTKIYTWDEVVTVVNKAARDYERKKQGRSMAWVGSLFDTVGKNGKTFNAWLSLLPDGDYSSVACGAFKLIINSAIHFHNLRKKVFDALTAIPATLENAQLSLKMWKSVKLHELFSDLYVAVLLVFRELLKWLTESAVKTAMKSFFGQGGSGSKIDDLLHHVGLCAAKVKDEAVHCSHIVIGSINQRLDIHTTSVNGLKVTVEGLRGDIGQVNNTLVDIEGKLKAVLNSFYVQLKSCLHDFNAGQRIQTRGVANGNQAKKELTPDGLKKLIRHDSLSTQRDINSVLAKGRAFEIEEQEAADQFMKSDRFEDWLTSDARSRVLIANLKSNQGKTSSASFACGLLANLLLFQASAITLVFFSGLHLGIGDEDAGAKQLLASLIGQLLDQHGDFDLSFLHPKQQDHLQNRDVELLCTVLSSLLRQLPRGSIVICMLDGVSYYETAELEEDMCAIVECITAVMNDTELSAIMKMLITSPTRCRRVDRFVRRNDIFNVPVIDSQGQGISSRALERRMQRQIQDLPEGIYERLEWDSETDDGTSNEETS